MEKHLRYIGIDVDRIYGDIEDDLLEIERLALWSVVVAKYLSPIAATMPTPQPAQSGQTETPAYRRTTFQQRSMA
jgi:hypothetical protein